MNAGHDLERRVADHYASEAPPRAPDRVLGAVLETIDHTPQRRVLVRVPRRSPSMNMFARVAVAAVALIAVGALGVAVLRPGGGTGGAPVATPSASPSPSPSPTQSAEPSSSLYVPPDLTGTFTSTIHGISISFPDGWATRAASEPWTAAGPPLFQDPAGDVLYDTSRDSGHLFVGLASQPLAGMPADTWAANLIEAVDCGPAEPAVIDGAEGLAGTNCPVAAVSIDERGYVIVMNVSPDDAGLREFDAHAWFDEVLATVQLHPEDALDAAPSSSP